MLDGPSPIAALVPTYTHLNQSTGVVRAGHIGASVSVARLARVPHFIPYYIAQRVPCYGTSGNPRKSLILKDLHFSQRIDGEGIVSVTDIICQQNVSHDIFRQCMKFNTDLTWHDFDYVIECIVKSHANVSIVM